MSVDMYLMEHGILSDVEDDEFAQFALDSMEEAFNSFLGTDIQIYESRITDTPIVTRGIPENETTDNPLYANMRQMLVKEGIPIQCGNYIRKWDGWWQCVNLPGSNGFYRKVFIQFCNYNLKFVSPKTGSIVEYPVYTENSTRYNNGEKISNKMTVGTQQYSIYIPMNDETIMVGNGVRFLMDKYVDHPTAFRLTQVDTVNSSFGDKVGLLRWTVVEDMFNEVSDSPENMVADLTQYNNPLDNEESSSYYG